MVTQTYFLGGATPSGFKTDFLAQIKKPGFYTYILKGGPGTGKSTLMKKAVKALDSHELSVYYCSSDTRSLDAVVDNDKKIIIVDGTAPHVFEALYPGAAQEIINLGEYWDGEKLRSHADSIKYCLDENAEYHLRARRCIEAVSAVNSDIYRIGEECLNRKKISAYIVRLMKKLIPRSKEKGQGALEYRQLSALTADGYTTMPISKDNSVYLLKDDLLAGSDLLLKKLADSFLSAGYDVYASRFYMLPSPAVEHIIVPELKLAFVTGSFFNSLSPDSPSVINFARFYDKERLSEKRSRLSFDRKASLELAKEGTSCIDTALKIHDELEKYYIGSIDFKSLGSMTDALLQKLAE